MERREKSIAQQQSIDNLHKADKLKDEFLANTSHELRTPLNGIIGIAESLRDGALGSVSDAIKKNLSMIAVSGRRLAALVNDILDFSKLKNNDIELSLKSVDIRMVVDTVIEISNILFGSKEIPEVTESVTVSSIRDTQIFENKITENEDQKNVVEVSEMHINEDDKSISILAVDEINQNSDIDLVLLDIMIYRAEKDEVELVETNGMWIGLMDDLSRNMTDDKLSLSTGDKMLLYSDGITEAWKKETVKEKRSSDEMFGDNNLQNLFCKLGKFSTDEIKSGILKELEVYDCGDDVTMVVLERL